MTGTLRSRRNWNLKYDILDIDCGKAIRIVTAYCRVQRHTLGGFAFRNVSQPILSGRRLKTGPGNRFSFMSKWDVKLTAGDEKGPCIIGVPVVWLFAGTDRDIVIWQQRLFRGNSRLLTLLWHLCIGPCTIKLRSTAVWTTVPHEEKVLMNALQTPCSANCYWREGLTINVTI